MDSPDLTAAPPAAFPSGRRFPTDLELERDPVGALSRLPTDADLPCEDGEPMETPWHRYAMTVMIESLEHHWRDRDDYYVGGNMFVHFSEEEVFNRDFRGPDFFVVKGVVRNRPRRTWDAWHEGGRLPNVVIELASESTLDTDYGDKMRVYAEQVRTAEYLIYNPIADQLDGWRLTGSRYTQPLTRNGGRLWSEELGLFVGTWDGEYIRTPGRWVRFFDTDGRLVLTGREAEYERAEAEKSRAEQAVRERDQERTQKDALQEELARLRAELAALKQPPPQP